MRLIVPGERSEVEEVGSCGRIYHIAARRALLFDNRYRLLMRPLIAAFSRRIVADTARRTARPD